MSGAGDQLNEPRAFRAFEPGTGGVAGLDELLDGTIEVVRIGVATDQAYVVPQDRSVLVGVLPNQTADVIPTPVAVDHHSIDESSLEIERRHW